MFAFYDYPGTPYIIGYDHNHGFTYVPDGYNIQSDFFVHGGTVYDLTSPGAIDEVWPYEVRNAYVQKGSLQNIFPPRKILRPHIADPCPLNDQPKLKLTLKTKDVSDGESDGDISFR